VIVAVPLITTVVILVQETWVREIEETDAIRAAEALQVPDPGLPVSEVREPLSPRA